MLPPGDSERLYLVDEKSCLHIQSTYEGLACSLYDAVTGKEPDGGQFDMESIVAGSVRKVLKTLHYAVIIATIRRSVRTNSRKRT